MGYYKKKKIKNWFHSIFNSAFILIYVFQVANYQLKI